MSFTIEAGKGDCSIIETSPSSSNKFTMPIEHDQLVAGLKSILAKPDMREHSVGAVRIDRMRDGLRINAGNGAYVIPYTQLYPIILGDV